MSTTIYRRSESNWIGSTGKSTDVSINYWRAQARKIFERHPSIEIVEIVKTGRKTDSTILPRGDQRTPSGIYVIIASTGGRYGKSRKDYLPADCIR